MWTQWNPGSFRKLHKHDSISDFKVLWSLLWKINKSGKHLNQTHGNPAVSLRLQTRPAHLLNKVAKFYMKANKAGSPIPLCVLYLPLPSLPDSDITPQGKVSRFPCLPLWPAALWYQTVRHQESLEKDLYGVKGDRGLVHSDLTPKPQRAKLIFICTAGRREEVGLWDLSVALSWCICLSCSVSVLPCPLCQITGF